jgi:xylitol oxidase
MSSDLARNWSGNIVYGARATHAPHSIDDLQSIVRAANKLRVIGSRHSFNAIADTDGELVSLHHLNRVLSIDAGARTVTVEGGATYRDVAPALDAAGFALANLASLPHITIAGACATGTHGSGNTNPGLAAAVAGLTFVASDGDLVRLKRGDPDFAGAPVHLGALGPVVDITLDIAPRYEARQDVFLDLPFASLVGNFDAITASAYSVSIFSRWLGDSVGQIWLKSLGDAPPLPRELFGARPTDYPVPLIPRPDAPPATERLGTNAPWHYRISHYPIDADIPTGAELQTEYFVARADAPAALAALHAIQDRFSPLLQISEIRTVAADELWLSGCYRRDSVALHFAWHPDWPAVSAVLPLIEAALAPFDPRAHWGKLFTMSRDAVQFGYPRLADFRALAHRHDPHGKFRNAFVDAHIF